jgi:transposase
MKETKTVGVDLAKQVFHVVCRDKHEREVRKRMLRRGQVLGFFANLPPCLVGMEACAGAHEWARKLRKQGHEVKLIAPQHVKAYVRGQKNDYNDARGIAEAVRRPDMKFVEVKTVAQQDIQALHRLRRGCLDDRTRLSNQIRGLLAEYGIVLAQGVGVVRAHLPELLEDGGNGLSGLFRGFLARSYEQLRELDEHIEFYTGEVERLGKQEEAQQRLQTIPGFGPIVASVFHSAIGNGQAFAKGRDVSASLGLVPRQHSSGGKEVLLGITKRGDGYLRSLLVHGARAVVRQAANKDDPLSRWILRIKAQRGYNKAVVALANKLARIGWAVLRHQKEYTPKPTRQVAEV